MTLDLDVNWVKLLEKADRKKRDRRLLESRRAMVSALSAVFRRQSILFIVGMNQINGRLDGAEWIEKLGAAQSRTASDLTKTISTVSLAAAVLGGSDMISKFGAGFGLFFGLSDERATAYAAARAAEMVTKINQTTRDQLRSLMTTAVKKGWSWQRAKSAIKEKFKNFSTKRAKRIAIFETGNAYEAGQDMAIEKLTNAGLKMEQRWLTANDGRVRSEHRKNARQGFIPVGQKFQSGHGRPPTDPGCRCTRVFRRGK